MGWVVKPGEIAHARIRDFWDTYVRLVDVHKDNIDLSEELDRLRLELMELSEKAASVSRLEALLDFSSPAGWSSSGARVVAHNFGPLSAVNSLIIDRGKFQGVTANMPVICPDGVLGRTYRSGLNFSSVLLLTDLNSRIPVISSRSRVSGIISGQGYHKSLVMQYVHLNSELEEGEILLTSGLAGIYPKGLPVAEVINIVRSEISLFLVVEAETLVDFKNREEVLIMENSGKIKTQKLHFEE
ncbi:MAG: rod shape-determining protein MreC [Desulfonatronovibrio sp.]